MAAAAAIILLTLSVAFTAATAHLRPPPPPSSANQTLLIKICESYLIPNDAAALVPFCAGNLLRHRAALLATCGRRETVAVVLKEAHAKAAALAAFGAKIDADEHISAQEHDEIKNCWGYMNDAILTSINVGFDYDKIESSDGGVAQLGMGLKKVQEKFAAAKVQCKPAAGDRRRSGGLWAEMRVLMKESLEADVVALAFVNYLNQVAKSN